MAISTNFGNGKWWALAIVLLALLVAVWFWLMEEETPRFAVETPTNESSGPPVSWHPPHEWAPPPVERELPDQSPPPVVETPSPETQPALEPTEAAADAFGQYRLLMLGAQGVAALWRLQREDVTAEAQPRWWRQVEESLPVLGDGDGQRTVASCVWTQQQYHEQVATRLRPLMRAFLPDPATHGPFTTLLRDILYDLTPWLVFQTTLWEVNRAVGSETYDPAPLVAVVMTMPQPTAESLSPAANPNITAVIDLDPDLQIARRIAGLARNSETVLDSLYALGWLPEGLRALLALIGFEQSRAAIPSLQRLRDACLDDGVYLDSVVPTISATLVRLGDAQAMLGDVDAIETSLRDALEQTGELRHAAQQQISFSLLRIGRQAGESWLLVVDRLLRVVDLAADSATGPTLSGWGYVVAMGAGEGGNTGPFTDAMNIVQLYLAESNTSRRLFYLGTLLRLCMDVRDDDPGSVPALFTVISQDVWPVAIRPQPSADMLFQSVATTEELLRNLDPARTLAFLTETITALSPPRPEVLHCIARHLFQAGSFAGRWAAQHDAWTTTATALLDALPGEDIPALVPTAIRDFLQFQRNHGEALPALHEPLQRLHDRTHAEALRERLAAILALWETGD